jgi:hypothetical protein
MSGYVAQTGHAGDLRLDELLGSDLYAIAADRVGDRLARVSTPA